MLIITCEHGGNSVPHDFKNLFFGQQDVLNSHRGWDAGALGLAQQIAQKLSAPLFASTVTRLLVDLNRSVGHKHLHASQIQSLIDASKQEIIARYYTPHRMAVLAEIDRAVAGGSTVHHIAVHSFTPQLNGVLRNADVALLYDARRSSEKHFALQWLQQLGSTQPELKLRRNYPYNGKDDGLTSMLRKKFSAHVYIGIELEINQKLVRADLDEWESLRSSITLSLGSALRKFK